MTKIFFSCENFLVGRREKKQVQGRMHGREEKGSWEEEKEAGAGAGARSEGEEK